MDDACLAPSARIHLARGLGAQKVEAARTTLEGVVGTADAPDEVRAAAAEALGLLGNPAARDALPAVDDEASSTLRRAVALARQRLDRRAAEGR